MGTLDELAAAARAADRQRYCAALRVARRQEVTDAQIKDAFFWGQRSATCWASFTWQGEG